MKLPLEAFVELQNDMNLVPMLIQDDNFPPYQIGTVAGFPPDRAMELYETFTFRGSNIRVAVPVDENGQPLRLSAAPEPAPPPAGPVVDIPDGWESQHHLALLTLAGKIAGSRPNTVDQAKEIIRAEEMKRRT